jgi:acetyl-CoA acyltransferase
MAREVWIIEGVRTPMGKRNGWLREVHPVRLGSTVVDALLTRAALEPAKVEHVVWGTVSQVGEQTFNIARNIVLDSSLPVETAATSLDFQCGSGQQAAHVGAALIASGQYDVVITGGVESMSRVPMFSSVLDKQPFTDRIAQRHELMHQGLCSDKIARLWNISRAEVDQIGYESHIKAAKATAEGIFQAEIVPLEGVDEFGKPIPVTRDQGIRPETSLEKMASLVPVFDPEGVTTAGNSSQITDGAAALLLVSAEKAKELGLKPKARIVAATTVGSDPHLMLTGPVPATKKVLQKAGLTLADIDLIEINEAFATVVAMWLRETGADMKKVNVHGGAIALGHPLGASGARLTVTLLNALEVYEKRFGLQTVCCGGGMATAMIVERL